MLKSHYKLQQGIHSLNQCRQIISVTRSETTIDSIHCHCQYRRSIAIYNIQISRHYSSASNASVSDLRIRKQSQRERQTERERSRLLGSIVPIDQQDSFSHLTIEIHPEKSFQNIYIPLGRENECVVYVPTNCQNTRILTALQSLIKGDVQKYNHNS